jgi:hypothetical protein
MITFIPSITIFMRNCPIVLGFIIFFSFCANGQSGFSSLGGAHYLAFARAGVAMDGGSSIYLNQAGITSVQKWSADISVERRFNLQELTQLSFSLIKSMKIGSFGVMASNFGFDQYNEQKICLVYARKLSSTLSLGGQFDILRYNIENIGSKNLLSFEVGMLLKINRQLSLGTHVFSPVNVEVTNGDEINTRFRAGIKYSPSNKVFLLADLDKVLDRSLEFKFGFGYQPIQILEVRAGMNPTISQYSFGFRLTLKDKFKVSSAFGMNNILGNTPALSIQYEE